MSLQSRSLVMVGLGAQGLFPDVEDGNHLRWQFDPGLGFPPYGFDLYRRNHIPGRSRPFGAATDPEGRAALPGVFRKLTLQLRLDGGTGPVVGRFLGNAIVEESSGGSEGAEVRVELEADAIDELLCPAGTVVTDAEGVAMVEDAEVGWGAPLNGSIRICLPLTDASYPCRHANAPNDATEAEERLRRRTSPGGAITLPPEIATRYGGQAFQGPNGLRSVLPLVAKPDAPAAGPKPVTETTPAGLVAARMGLDAYRLLLLASIDPNIARELGLLWVDRDAPGVLPFDYKIVGYWSTGTTKKTTCVGFGPVTVGTPVTPGTVITPAGIPATVTFLEVSDAVVVESESPWGSGHGIEVRALAPLRLRVNEPAERVTLHAALAEESLEVGVFGRDGEPLEAEIVRKEVAEGFAELLVGAPAIADLELSSRLPFMLYEVCTPQEDGCVDFEALPVRSFVEAGTVVGAPRGPDAVTFLELPEAIVVEAESPWSLPHGLALGSLGRRPLRFQVSEPREEIAIFVAVTGRRLRVQVFGSDGELLEAQVETEEAGTGFVQVVVRAAGIKTVEVFGGAITIYQVCTATAVPLLVKHEWICFNVARGSAPALDRPHPLTAAALPAVDVEEAPLLRPSTIKDRHGLAAGLSWPLSIGATAMLSRGSIAYHVFRRDLGNQGQPDPTVNLADLTQYTQLTVDTSAPGGRYPVPVRPLGAVAGPRPKRPPGWPGGPLHYIDGDVLNRWYGYAVEGVDLFGRTSAPGTGVAELKDTLPPPPPVAAEARFIDPSLKPDDPDYDSILDARIPAGADGAILLRWEWPSHRYRQGADVREFRIYWQSGRLNTYAGEVTAVSSGGDESSATVTLDGGTIAQQMTDAWLRVGEEYFEITGSGTGNPLTVEVQNLRLTRDPSGLPKPPDRGRCTIAVGPGETHVLPRHPTVPLTDPRYLEYVKPADPNFVDYRDSRAWASRVGVVPLVQPSEGKIVSTTEPEPGLRRVVTDMSPVSGTGGAQLVGGSLVAAAGSPPGLNEFRVLSANKTGIPPRLVFEVASGDLTPSGDCAWFPGYEAVLANPGLVVGSAATAAGAIGISSADVRDNAADPRGDPARKGNEGDVSAPLVVMRSRRAAVPAGIAPAASLPAGEQHIFASVPDYYSRSFYTLTWPASTAPGASYVVYRALDEALFLRDREQRRARTGHYATTGSFADDPGFQTWFAGYATGVPGLTQSDLTADPTPFTQEKRAQVDNAWEDWAGRFYPARSDAEIKSLAERAGNETIFVRLNDTPLGTSSYQDTLDGRSASRFLFRVRTIDIAANQSPLSPASLPVYIPDVVLPAPPTLLEAAGGPKEIALRWAAVADGRLDHYRLYRTGSVEDAADPRTMTLHRRIAKSQSASPPSGQVSPTALAGGRLEFIDGDQPAGSLIPGKTYQYRLIAVDGIGNRSEPSAIVSGRAYQAPPAPPSMNPPARGTTSVTLSWTHATDQGLSCLVERSAAGSEIWRPTSAWLPAGKYDFTDEPPDLDASWEYRLRVRDAFGQTAASLPTVTLPASA